MSKSFVPGAPLIHDSLVGRHARFDEHGNGVYGDAYLSVLNQAYPLTEVLGIHLEDVIAKSHGAMSLFTTRTPIQDLEAEGILRKILHASACAKLWQPTIIEEKDYGDRTRLGVEVAKRFDFVKPSELYMPHRFVILPGQKFVEYCAQRAGQ